VFRDYYATKVRKPPAPDEMFLEDLVTEMEQNETDGLSVVYLQRHERLGSSRYKTAQGGALSPETA